MLPIANPGLKRNQDLLDREPGFQVRSGLFLCWQITKSLRSHSHCYDDATPGGSTWCWASVTKKSGPTTCSPGRCWPMRALKSPNTNLGPFIEVLDMTRSSFSKKLHFSHCSASILRGKTRYAKSNRPTTAFDLQACNPFIYLICSASKTCHSCTAEYRQGAGVLLSVAGTAPPLLRKTNNTARPYCQTNRPHSG